MEKKKKKISRKKLIVIIICVILALAVIAASGPLVFFIQNLNNGDDGSYTPVPKEYTKEEKNGGSVVALDYAFSTADKTYQKTAYVYLPNGYTDTKQYNILYFMHGAGESATSLIKGAGARSETKNILDNMIAKGDIDPMIVVFPTIYNGDETDPGGRSLNNVSIFEQELVNFLIPAVESKYSTYASATDPDTLQATREHRAFGGYSMGSMTTWHVFATCLDYFKWYIPMSGGSREGVDLNGDPRAKAEYLDKLVKDSGYSQNDFFLYCFIGGIDSAYNGLVSQIREMIKQDSFVYGDDITEGNLYLSIKPMQIHDMKSAAPGAFYNALPTLFIGQ